MITINYNGKTYKITRYDGIITQLEEWIMSGGLEEVKENKEPTYIAVDPAIPNSVDAIKYACEFKPTTDPSILEKLREELEKIIADYSKRGMRDGDHMDYWVDGKVWGLKEALDILASLETPQFTPGQEIECSHTGKEGDWFKEKFTKMVGVNKDLYGVEGEESWYRFARPIEDKIDHDQVKENIRVMDEQDGVKIEPELPSVPDFKAHSGIDGDTYFPWELQIELLTIFCQALSRQKPTK